MSAADCKNDSLPASIFKLLRWLDSNNPLQIPISSGPPNKKISNCSGISFINAIHRDAGNCLVYQTEAGLIVINFLGRKDRIASKSAGNGYNAGLYTDGSVNARISSRFLTVS